MGCDIHVCAERRDGDRWVHVPMEAEPFSNRNYRVFGFLANVRNYSVVPPIAMPRGFPEDASEDARKDYTHWDWDAHTPSWLTVEELTNYDYDQTIEDRRYIRQEGPNYFNGAATCEPGDGERMPLREFLGEQFFSDLTALKESGAERVVFWFDN